jgi:ribosomal protein L16 Arg81 hydroxylase
VDPRRSFHEFDFVQDMGSEVAHFVLGRDPRTPHLQDPFAHGGGVNVEIKEGDLLFLPAGWWHQVSSHEGQHIAINYWWRPPGWEGLFRFEQEILSNMLQKLKFDEEHDKKAMKGEEFAGLVNTSNITEIDVNGNEEL